MENSVIKFDKVSKSYYLSRFKYGRLTEEIRAWFKKVVTLSPESNSKQKLWAVRNLSFQVKKGVTLGIIGKNGAGKSTILKLISKVTYPDSGQIRVEGEIGAFIELGAGLHPELTGRENIYLYGAILGMKRREIDERFPEIVKFSELARFLDTPIKRYSSGMYTRLGFSVIAFTDPQVLLIDEVLAVGDKSFQEKCLMKMEEFAKSDKTVVFVSHNLEAIRSICSETILIDHGRLKARGKSSEVIKKYLNKYSKNSKF